MTQPQYTTNGKSRRTTVVRVPKRYTYLVKAFAHWLATYPNQSQLWDSEEILGQLYEQLEMDKKPLSARAGIIAKRFTELMSTTVKY